MKPLFILMLFGVVGMGAVFGRVGERRHYPARSRYLPATPTVIQATTEIRSIPSQTDAAVVAPCVIDWSGPVTEENLVKNSDCYRLLYYDPVSQTFPGAPPFCPPLNSAWEQYFDQSYLNQWCYGKPPPTPTEIDPYPPPGYP